MDSALLWAQSVVARGELGHQDRDDRLIQILAQMARQPGASTSEIFPVRREARATDRFVEHPDFDEHDLLAGITRATAHRARGYDESIGVVDGSSVAHTDGNGDDGVGSIGSHAAGGRGLKVSMAVLMTTEGVELGLGAMALWARPLTPSKVPHDKRALRDKESRWWVELPRQAEARLREEGARTRIHWHFDSEADMWPVFEAAEREGRLITVRQHCDRVLSAQPIGPNAPRTLRVLDELRYAPSWGEFMLDVPREPGRTPRKARMDLRVVHVGLRLRTAWSHRSVGSASVAVVWVREIDPPPGEEPLEWVLWTTYPVYDFEDALEVVRRYRLRFRIEGCYFAIKSGCCRVEQSQRESFHALAKWITLQCAVGIHRQAILHQARTEPEVSAAVAFDRDQIDAALLLYTRHRRDAPPPGSELTLAKMVEIVATLGGYTGKSSGGPPGLKTFGRGMDRVTVAAEVLRLQRSREGPT